MGGSKKGRGSPGFNSGKSGTYDFIYALDDVKDRKDAEYDVVVEIESFNDENDKSDEAEIIDDENDLDAQDDIIEDDDEDNDAGDSRHFKFGG